MTTELIAQEYLKNAIIISYLFHYEQFRRDGTTPYISHPIAVSYKMDNVQDACIALLHDVLEDTDMTIDKLRSYNFSEYIINGVIALTHIKGECTYIEYISNIPAKYAHIKIEDINHNLITATKSEVIRYKKALNILEHKVSFFNKK